MPYFPPGGSSGVSTPTANTLVQRDSSANFQNNNIALNYATTATAAATTTLTVGSSYQQYFTGVTTQIVVLPDATTLSQTGFQFRIVNLSTGTLTIKNNAASTLTTIATNTIGLVTCTSIGSSNGTWDFQKAGITGGTVTSVALSLPNIITVSGSPITSSGTLSGTLATQAAGSYFGGPQGSSASGTPSFKTFAVPTNTIFNSGSGNYTSPVGAFYLIVRLQGGGGGGGGSSNGAADGGTGGAGGDTTLGSATASGGSGGSCGGVGGSAAANSALSFTYIDSKGADGGFSQTSASGGGGGGGSSPLGSAGAGGPSASAGTNAGANSGSGGGGGGGNTPTQFSGSGGASGGFLEYRVAVSISGTTLAYSVGAGGAGGTAGTSGFAAGNGAAGKIIIVEYYQ